MKKIFATLFGLACLAGLRAHECGPAQITTYINRRAYYEIQADVSESQATVYSLFLNSEPAVASVAPVTTFSSFQKGVWVITGNKVGTSIATFHWVYAPNNASGDCIVEIIVKPESEAPPLTGSNHDQSTHGGDPINLYTGELIQQEEPDLNLGGPMPLYFSRYYASGLTRDGQVLSALGGNWSHNFDDRLNRTDNQIEVITSRGRIVRFERVGADWILRSSSIVPFQLVEVGTDYRFLDPRDNRVFAFNSAGQLTSISDGKGNQHVLTYSGTVVTNVSDGLGRQLTFRYQAHNQLASVSDGPRTVFFGYSFDALEALNSVFDATGQTIRYVYGGTPTTGPLLLRRTEPEGNSLTTQTYDSDGRVITQSFAPGSTNMISYQTNLAIMTDPLGNTRRFEFNTNAALIRAVDEDGKEVLYTYDTDGRQTSIKDRRGGVTQFGWHTPSGRVASIIYPDQTSNTWTHASHAVEGLAVWEQNKFTERDGAFETMTLNALGQVTDRVDAGGFHWGYNYNANNRILTEMNPAGGGMTNEYNADGTLTSTSDARGKVMYAYDALRRLIQHKNADGTFAGFAYDAADRVLRRTNELAGVYIYQRDRNGRITRQTDPENYATTYTHDAADRITNISETRGSTQFGFNERGELSSLTDPDGAQVGYKYDRVGNLVETTNGPVRVWKQTYGPESVLTGIIDPMGRASSFESDLIGRIVKSTDAVSNVKQYGYDGRGRQTRVSGPAARTMQRSYDARGQTTYSSVGSSEVEAHYAYDSLGGMTNTIDPRGYSWRNEFDSEGQLIGRVDPLGNKRTYELDARHRPTRVTLPANMGSVDITFNGLNDVTSRKYSDGTQVDYVVDKRGWLKSATGVALTRNPAGEITGCNGIAIERTPGGRILSVSVGAGKTIVFEYSFGNELTRITDWLGGVTEFTYDAAGFPDSMKRPNGITSTFTVDAMGQVIATAEGTLASIQLQRGADGQVLRTQRLFPLAMNPAGAAVTRTFDGASQVTGFAYDALGRLTRDGRRTYSWDLAGRLTSYTENGVTVKMEYDAFIRRTARIQGNTTNTFIWNYAYRKSSISIEQVNGVDLRYYVHTPDGLLLYSIDAATGARTHYHFDEAGNTMFLTDDQKNVVAAYSYGPYGELLATSGTSDNAFTFQGKFGVMKEGATGLYYMQARYFDSDTVHFLSRDPLPLTSPDALNPYQYAFGNPVLYNDPTGLKPATLKTTSTPPPAATPPPIIDVSDSEFRAQIRIMKNKLWDQVSRSRGGALDPGIPGAFDSKYLENGTALRRWRGRILNGGELNYYFQGMYWKEATGSRSVMYSAIYTWKLTHYGTGPSDNDMMTANIGFDETNTFAEEFRNDVCTIIEGLVGAPSGSISGWFGASSPIPSLSPYPTPSGFIPGF